jgi:deoxyribodipyrimidine photolyase-related protein
MAKLCLILGDQLSPVISSLKGIRKKTDKILMCEVVEEATYVNHHKKKIVLIFAAMRHFAEELIEKGYNVIYVKIDDPENTGSFISEVTRVQSLISAEKLIVTHPSEYRVLQDLKKLEDIIPLEIKEDDRFLVDIATFKKWSLGKKQLRMEFFYREMRKKYGILLDEDGNPTGGKWNYDKENRLPPKKGTIFPSRKLPQNSLITIEVINVVKAKFKNHFGDLETFDFAVTRSEALNELDYFVDEILPQFGTFQDAMVSNQPFLFHSKISAYLNCGLLSPLEVCKSAEKSYVNEKTPLNSAEGFIRQILGWREFVRGIYWLHMPEYGKLNYFNTTTPLPEFYWSGKTKMFCISEVVRHTNIYAYSHHIQRLMITGNFALIAGLNVAEVQYWYLSVYADAYEWVEMPNTLGMALFGDGGIIASKPYAASGKYISRMSDYCKNCSYNPDVTTGDEACPYNSLYWDFMVRNEEKLRLNPRIPYVFSTWDKFDQEKKISIRKQATKILVKMNQGDL